MPELPEVEIVKKSLKKNVKDKKILDVIVTNRNLRFKVEKDFEKILNIWFEHVKMCMFSLRFRIRGPN